MKEYLDIIKKAEIMRDIESDSLEKVLTCLNSRVNSFKRGSIIAEQNDVLKYVAIVLSGQINIVKTDYFGNKNFILKLFASDIFGESVCFSKQNRLPFSIEAEVDSQILMFDSNCISTPCNLRCKYHFKLIENMLYSLASKNTRLTRKINILTLRTTKEKVLELLAQQSSKNGNVWLNMSRQEMADYLSVDRSALSRELAKMKDEGIIDFDKNHFVLL